MKYVADTKIVQKWLDDKYGKDVCFAFGTTGVLLCSPKPEIQTEHTIAPFQGSSKAGLPMRWSYIIYHPKNITIDFSDFTEYSYEEPNERNLTITGT